MFFSMLTFSSEFAKAQQQDPQPQKLKNVEWKRIYYTVFKPGKTARAREIILDHFKLAGDKVGYNAETFFIRIGEWDMISIWSLNEGTEDLNWQTSPGSALWRKELNKQEGGEEKALALIQEWQSLISHSKSELAVIYK